MKPSWEAYWNIGIKPGRRGQTLFKLEQMHKTMGGFYGKFTPVGGPIKDC